MFTPSQKGERSEAAILHALVAAGRVVLMPWGASQRYDFVIDDGNGRFTRVQCKSGVYRHGCVYFRTASADRRRPNGDHYVGQSTRLRCTVPSWMPASLCPSTTSRRGN